MDHEIRDPHHLQAHFACQPQDWKRDRAGVYHWTGRGYDLRESATLCLSTHGAVSAAWFWFNGSPAPVIAGEDPTALMRRWNAWREAFQAGGTAFFDKLAEWSTGRRQ